MPKKLNEIDFSKTRLLRFPEVKTRVGLSRSSIHLMIKNGDFPAPIKLGARASAWLEPDINEWIEGRINACR